MADENTQDKAALEEAQRRFDRATYWMKDIRNNLDKLIYDHDGKTISSVQSFYRVRQGIRDDLYKEVVKHIEDLKDGSLRIEDIQP